MQPSWEIMLVWYRSTLHCFLRNMLVIWWILSRQSYAGMLRWRLIHASFTWVFVFGPGCTFGFLGWCAWSWGGAAPVVDKAAVLVMEGACRLPMPYAWSTALTTMPAAASFACFGWATVGLAEEVATVATEGATREATWESSSLSRMKNLPLQKPCGAPGKLAVRS